MKTNYNFLAKPSNDGKVLLQIADELHFDDVSRYKKSSRDRSLNRLLKLSARGHHFL